MNTNINKFSLKRMLRFMVADMYNRRVMLVLFVSLAFLGTVVFYFLNHDFVYILKDFSDLDDNYYLNSNINSLYTGVKIAITLTCTIYLSMVFTPFFKRGYAAQNIMLPASRSEKFISRILDVVIVSALIYGICWAISAIYGAYMGASVSFVSYNYVMMENGEVSLYFRSAGEIMVTVAGIFFLVSIYFFGATFWRKLHYIKTTATLLGLIIAGTLFEQFVVDIVLDIFRDEEWAYVVAILGLGFLGLAWMRFRSIQIKG